MKKLLIICIIALVAAFGIESATKDCCKDKEATSSEVPDCCKNKEHTDSNSSETSDVPDCCSGE